MKVEENTHTNIEEIRALILKQQKLEKELELLKESLDGVQQKNENEIEKVHMRIDGLEKEIEKMSVSIDNVISSVERVQQTVNNVYKAVGKIEGKQDKTIEVQEVFIRQLWKAFFTILGIVTTASGIILALFK